MVADDVQVFGPYGDSNDTFVSPGYAKGTDFEDDFTSWSPMRADRIEQHGYLVGFPKIDIPTENRSMNCVHIWFNNMDVIYSIAIPLAGVENVYVHSQTRTNLQMELDRLSEGDNSVYEIPLARNTQTGEEITRRATYDDIAEIIKARSEVPVAVLSPPTRSVIKSRRIPEADKCTLLDTQ